MQIVRMVDTVTEKLETSSVFEELFPETHGHPVQETDPSTNLDAETAVFLIMPGRAADMGAYRYF